MTTTAKKAAPAYDENLIVEDLLKLHAATIAEVKTLCAAELALQDSDDYRTKHPAAYVYDDLALLRYVLSYKKASAVKKPLAQGIAYREASPWLADPKNPAAAQISEFLCSGLHGSLRDGSPFQIIRAGVSNPPAVVKSVPFDELVKYFMYEKEEMFKECDRLTRETGRIVKAISINDFTGVGMMMNRTFFKALGDSSKISENLYPSLLGTAIVHNPPTFFRMMFSIGKLFVSKKMLEKIRMCPRKGNSIADCPFASQYLTAETTPTFLGGDCECGDDKACINNVPNTVKSYAARTEWEAARVQEALAKVNLDSAEEVTGLRVDPDDLDQEEEEEAAAEDE